MFLSILILRNIANIGPSSPTDSIDYDIKVILYLTLDNILALLLKLFHSPPLVYPCFHSGGFRGGVPLHFCPKFNFL